MSSLTVLYKAHGIIIKKEEAGEFDNLLTVYTKEFGKLVFRAKSVRKRKAKLASALEPFLCSYLMVAPGKGLDIITGAEIVEGFTGLHSSLDALLAASYFCELYDKLIPAPEKDKRIWDLLLFGLRKLNAGSDAKELTGVFEKQLIKLLGYGSKSLTNLL